MTESIAQARALTKWFGKKQALKDVSFTIGRGDLYGFIGKNGAGKTTFMRILCGLMRPTQGSVRITGQAGPPRLGYLPQSIRFDENSSGDDILRFFCRIKRADGSRAMALARDMELDLGRKAAFLSPGQQRKLQLAVAAIGDPELLIFDEPTAGLDPVGIQHIRAAIRELHGRGCTVFVSSHTLPELSHLCTKVAIIDDGRILYQGPFESEYEVDVDDAESAACTLEGSRLRGRARISGGKVCIRAERAEIPGMLSFLHENGVAVYGVRPVGLEMFFNDRIREGA